MFNDRQKRGLWFTLGTIGFLWVLAGFSRENVAFFFWFGGFIFIVPLVVIGSVLLVSGSVRQFTEKGETFSLNRKKTLSRKMTAVGTLFLGLIALAGISFPFLSDLFTPPPSAADIDASLRLKNPEAYMEFEKVRAEEEAERQDAEEIAVQENKDCVSTLINYTASSVQKKCIMDHIDAFYIYFVSENVLSNAIGDKWKPKSAQLEKNPGTTAPSSIQFVYDVEGTQRGGSAPRGVIQIVESKKGQIDFNSYLAATKNGSDITDNINPKYKNDSNFSYKREIKREQVDGIVLFFDQIKRSDGKIFEPAIVFRLGDTDIAINGAYADTLDQEELHQYMLAFARSLIKSE